MPNIVGSTFLDSAQKVHLVLDVSQPCISDDSSSVAFDLSDF